MVQLALLLIHELGGLDAQRLRELEYRGEVGFCHLVCFDVDQCSVRDSRRLGQLLLRHEVPAPQNPHVFAQTHKGDYMQSTAP